MFSLKYESQSKTENVSGTCSGVIFTTEEMAWSYLDLVEKENYILSASLSEVK